MTAPTTHPTLPDVAGVRRRRRRQQSHRRRLAVGAAVVVVLAALGWLIGFSPLLAVDRVEVTGTGQLSVDQVMAAAAVPLGQSLLQVDPAAIAARVETLDPVAQADVSRHLFGTVAIAVTERVGLYALAQGSSWQLVDIEGRAFLALAEPPAGLLPVTMPEPSPRLQADVATVVAALPAVVKDQTTAVTADSADHIELTLISGATLFWGDAAQSDLKAEAAAALLALVPASHYDVSAPAYPAVRP
ncbi:MAG: FtsQ-type POTRA domain-containing protein [Propionibacteriaceae bacterium]|nr:FtsQ-type POTRA domain-containing protein [Propionibacteriaceae bacterium]